MGSKPIIAMLHLGRVAWAVCFAITGVSSTASTLSSSCSDFVPSTRCSEQDWAGAWKDMFSPDDPCPYSMRYVDYTAYDSGATQALHVSASDTDADCNSTWGRKYDVSSSVDPVFSCRHSTHAWRTSHSRPRFPLVPGLLSSQLLEHLTLI